MTRRHMIPALVVVGLLGLIPVTPAQGQGLQTPQPPVAVDDSATTSQDLAVSIDALDNDTDPDTSHHLLSIHSASNPSHGTAVVDRAGTPYVPSDDRIRYTPEAGWSGVDSFTYELCDAGGSLQWQWSDITGTQSLNYPYGISVDANGKLYIAEKRPDSSGKVGQVWELSSGTWTNLTDSAQLETLNGARAFNEPTGAVLDLDGALWVVEREAFKVWRRTAEGVWSDQTHAAGFVWPNGIAVDPQGNVYVVDRGNGEVRKLSRGGLNWTDVTDGASLSGPTAMVVAPNGDFYVADRDNDRVMRHTSTGWAEVAGGSLSGPYGVALDAIGNLYVSDTGHNKIKMFDGSTWTDLTGSQSLDKPYGTAADDAGAVYVVDRGNGKIRKLVGVPASPALCDTATVSVTVAAAPPSTTQTTPTPTTPTSTTPTPTTPTSTPTPAAAPQVQLKAWAVRQKGSLRMLVAGPCSPRVVVRIQRARITRIERGSDEPTTTLTWRTAKSRVWLTTGKPRTMNLGRGRYRVVVLSGCQAGANSETVWLQR